MQVSSQCGIYNPFPGSLSFPSGPNVLQGRTSIKCASKNLMKAALRPIDQHIFIRLVSRSTITIMSYLHFLSVGVSLERMEAFGQCWQSCSITLPKETKTMQEGLVLARSHAYHLLIETDSTAETTTCNVQLSNLPLDAKNLQSYSMELFHRLCLSVMVCQECRPNTSCCTCNVAVDHIPSCAHADLSWPLPFLA